MAANAACKCGAENQTPDHISLRVDGVTSKLKFNLNARIILTINRFKSLICHPYASLLIRPAFLFFETSRQSNDVMTSKLFINTYSLPVFF